MRRCLMITLILSLILLSACAGNGTRDAVGGNLAAGFAALTLPSPVELARSASFAEWEREQYGAQFDNAAVLENNVIKNNGSADYGPYWDPGDDLGNTAYACHTFMLDGYDGPSTLTLSWQAAPPAADLWIGLANYTRNRWDWKQTPDGSTLDFGSNADYFDAGTGQFAVVVLVLGHGDHTLDKLRVGGPVVPKLPPVAALEADRIYGVAPLTVSFDCAGSYDPDGTVTLSEADDTGDMVWDHTASGPALAWSKQFDGGTHTVTLQVTDSDGLTDTATVTIRVADSLSWPGNTIPPGDKEVCALWDVDGLPAVMWRGGDTNIYFQRAQDALGAAWDAPVTAESFSGGTWPIAAAVINGRPALVYENLSYGNEWFNLYFMIAKDALGTSWNEPIYVTKTPGYPNLAGYPELYEVEGRPAIAYLNTESGWRQLMLYRAQDALGMAWDAGVAVGNDEALGNSNLALIDGKPAFVVVNEPETTSVTALNFVRATDTAGTAWGEPVQLLDIGVDDVCYGVELASADGAPAVLYVTGAPTSGDTELYYQRAADALGADWSQPGTVVYSTVDYLTTPHLTTIAGYPTWAVQEWSPFTYGRILVARALDPAGSAWEVPAQVRYDNSDVADYRPFAKPQLGLSGGMLGCITSSYCAETMLSVYH